jgi:hypothetical protein
MGLLLRLLLLSQLCLQHWLSAVVGAAMVAAVFSAWPLAFGAAGALVVSALLL